MRKVDIGLDIGIASVGWALVDSETSEIIRHGVRLFDTVDNPKDSKLLNESRREKRHARRQKARRQNLKRDFVKMLIDNNVIGDVKFNRNRDIMLKEFVTKYINNNELNKELSDEFGEMPIYKLRMESSKGNIELTKQQVLMLMFWYLDNRGYKYTTFDEKRDDTVNGIAIKGRLPIEIQLDHYVKNGFIRGELGTTISADMWVKEILLVLKHQKVIGEEIIKKYMALFIRQRSFEQGPGNKLTVTKFGRYTSLKDGKYQVEKNEDGTFKEQFANIWDKTIGRCTYLPDETRCPKESASAQLFNLLNDLNNISVKTTGEKITEELKLNLIKQSFKVKDCKKSIIKELCSYFGLEENDEDQFVGFRVDKSGNRLLTNQTTAYDLGKKLGMNHDQVCNEIMKDGKFNAENIFDKIISELSKTKILDGENGRNERIKRLFDTYNIKGAPTDISYIKSSYSETHALSYKAIHIMMDELILTNNNQMQIATKIFNSKKKLINKKSNNISKEWINEVIGTPTVKRSLHQAINVFNALNDIIRNNCWKLDQVVIEMAREANNKEARQSLNDGQKYQEKINAEIKNYIKTSGENTGGNGNQIKKKLYLLLSQKCKDAYTGQLIDPKELLRNPNNFDVDHIIPRSQSFDNSIENVVLTRKAQNHNKRNMTPYQYLSKSEFDRMSALWIDWFGKGQPSDRKVFENTAKIDNLMTKVDFTKPENQLGFIQRNIVDTRYTTRALFEAIKNFSQVNELEIKVKAINGKMTNFARMQMEDVRSRHKLNRPEGCEDAIVDGKKSRMWHGHHAEDAYIITVLNKMFKDVKAVEYILNDPARRFEKLQENKNISLRTEAGIHTHYSELSKSIIDAREELNKKMNDVTFSRMQSSSINRKLFDDTLYRGLIVKDEKNNIVEGKLRKVSSIELLKMEKSQCEKYFPENPTDSSLLIARCDLKLYRSLQTIFKLHANEKLPFKAALPDGMNFIEVNYKTKSGSLITKVVKKLQIVGETKEIDKVVCIPNNGNSFQESLNAFYWQLFRNQKGKLSILPISALNAKVEKVDVLNGDDKIIIDNEKVDKLKQALKIDGNFVSNVKRGDVYKSTEGELYFISGAEYQSNKFEIKPINRQKSDERYATINTRMKGWTKIKLNILGIEDKKYKGFTF